MSREEECKGAPSLSFLFKKEPEENPPVLLPIIIPTKGLRYFPKTATVMKNDGQVKLQPKGKQLRGFRCKDILQSSSTYEMCGRYEPMKWLGKLCFTVCHRNVDTSKFGTYPRGFYGEMKPQPIDCIALFPSEKGYILLGGWPTRFSYRTWTSTGPIYDDDIIVELSAYQPMPVLRYDGSVAVTDCTTSEMMDILKDLIR